VFNATFSNISAMSVMATSFSGGRSQSTRREPPTMGKQMVSFITCGCESSAPFFICPSLRQDVLWYTNVRLSVRPFHMSRSNLRTLWPIHFKFHRVIGIDGLTVCILYGEISNFHSRVMGLYSSNCRQFFVYRAVN
jgi:hypothetical protein